MDKRQAELQTWLKEAFNQSDFTLTPASSDASFRRYFRVHFLETTMIAMDAPPEKERCEPFVAVAEHLLSLGVNAPQVLAKNLDAGFLALGDLGNQTYLDALNANTAPSLYQDASSTLIKMQQAAPLKGLPLYDADLLQQEMQLFVDWYIAKHLGHTLTAAEHTVIQNVFKLLTDSACKQAQVMVHRDYHSRNLMVTEQKNPGVLDFQDAVVGPITYDLVSLLRDAYIVWSEQEVIDWVARYWEQARQAKLPVSNDFSAFYRDFEWMGAQRHIKVLGIFARLHYRDGKSAYLEDLPVVMQYLQLVCERYVELHPLLKLLNMLDGRSQ